MTSATRTPDAIAAARSVPGGPRGLGRPVAFLVAALVVAGGTYVAGPLLQPARTPTAVQVLPAPGDVAPIADTGAPASGPTADGRLPIADRLAFWSARVDANPGDFLSLAQLGIVEAEQARLTIDLGGYERALAEIDRSLALVPAYPPTIRARGTIRFALHDFDGALADAETVLLAAPSDPTALALRGDAQVELGNPDAAVEDYRRLSAISPGPWLDVRLARLASATGDRERAVSLARKAVAEAASADPAEAGFYAYALGEYARLAGDGATARSSYMDALERRATDVAALVGLARIDAFEGRTTAAVAGLEAAAAIVPQPETLALLGDLQTMNGDPGATATFKTVRFIGQLGSIQGQVYDRQLLRFELDHTGASAAILDAARASLAARPDSTGHDLVAWALYRLGRIDEAAAEITAARAHGADDARLRFHDGAIALAQGHPSSGRALLAAAIADGPALDPIERAEAIDLSDTEPAE
jgi:tetratricopeptide (TPR) repeat protein